MIELNDGEIICSKCDGSGVHYNRMDISTFVCSKCLGRGKLDWIENIVGVKKYSWWADTSGNQLEGTICESN